jgi:hypothetical protein
LTRPMDTSFFCKSVNVVIIASFSSKVSIVPPDFD